jgi:hypothetical protein
MGAIGLDLYNSKNRFAASYESTQEKRRKKCGVSA